MKGRKGGRKGRDKEEEKEREREGEGQGQRDSEGGRVGELERKRE